MHLAGEPFDPAVAEHSGASVQPGFDVIVIGASAGGLGALTTLFAHLPRQLPVAIAAVLHLSRDRPSHLVEILARGTALRVVWARDGAPLRPGEIAVAPPDQHLIVVPGACFRLTHSAPVHFSRPSVDVLFASAASVFGARTLAVILTGNGVDGAAGVAAIHNAGGTVIAQDEASSEYFSMPREAIESGGVTSVLPVGAIGGAITRLVTSG